MSKVAGVALKEVVLKYSNEAKMGMDTFAKAIYSTLEELVLKQELLKLDGMLAIMNEFPTAEFVVKGYTDSTGSASGNLKLSDKRANAVKDYLVKMELMLQD